MWTIQFWQGWPRANRIFLLLFAIAFALTMIAMWVGHIEGPAPAIELRSITEPDFTEIPVDQFRKGPFDFTVRGNNYAIIQRQLGSLLQTSDVVSYGYLVALAVFVIGMLAVISTLSRFYYLVGMGMFILFVTSLSPELLGVLGNYGKMFTIVIMAFYGLASFYIFYFKTTASFLARVLVFTVITVFLWLVIYFLSATPSPFLFIAANSVEAGMIACALFIATVSHEIISGFMFVVTQGNKKSKSMTHFFVITLIYFINLIHAYAARFHFTNWDFITFDLYLLLTISAILGIWGIRQRHKVYEGIIDADPYGVFAFLLTGAFAFATIAMLMFSGNDTALNTVGDTIIFTHVGFSFIFIIYIVSNFLSMLEQNYAVHKVLYSPTNMPFFTFRFAGLITTLALVIYNTWQIPIHNAVSGYYNGIADVYYKIGNAPIAKAFYEQSRTYGFRGHHSNYALANIEGALFNADDERKFYGDASYSRPTQMSYLNWAQTYQTQNENMQAILVLQEGIKKLDNHESLDNTIAILYARMGLPDSAMRYLEKSKATTRFGNIANANILGMAAMGKIPASYDSTSSSDSDPFTSVNRLGLANTLNKLSSVTYTFPTDTTLSLAQAAQLSNYLLNKRYQSDTTFINKAIELARRPSNVGFKEAILFASSIAFYNSGETNKAFKALEEVTVSSELQGKYNNILTMWSLENDETERALRYADFSISQKFEEAKTSNAVAQTEHLISGMGDMSLALAAWDTVRLSKDSISSLLASRIRELLLLPSATINTRSDDDKYIFARYRLSPKDSTRLFELAATMTNEDLRGRTYLEHAQKLYAMDYPALANAALKKIIGLSLTDRNIGKQMAILEILTLIQMNHADDVLAGLKQNPIEFTGKDKKYAVYIEALKAQKAGDSVNAAKQFKWLSANPYFEDGLIAASKFFQPKGMDSYSMLVDGLLHHPSSVRIRKAYALEAARRGFADYASSALEQLKPVIGAKDHAALTIRVNELLAAAKEN
jgi:hypothetical protein